MRGCSLTIQTVIKGTQGKRAVTQRTSSPQDSTPSAGPLTCRCHGCKGGEGAAVHALWEHTRWWLCLTAIWRWRSSHIAHRASCATVMQHAPSTITAMTCCFSYPSLSCFRADTIDLFFVFFAPRRHLNRSSHPGTSMLCWQAIDHPRPSPPHHLHGPVNITSAGRCLAAPLPLCDLLYYYTSWQWILVSV